jgi:hypothetical protein
MNVQGNGKEGKIATAWAQFGAEKRSINVYRMRVLLLGNTFAAEVGQWDQSAPLVNRVVPMQLNVRERWKKER